MENAEEITGKKLFKVVEDLQKDKTLVTMTLVGRDDGVLTTVIGIVTEKDTSYFLVDPPSEFRETVERAKERGLLFEFTGKDKVPYSFRAAVEKISEKDFRVRFPEVMKRVQRRRHFRLRHPPGAKIHFTIDKRQYEADVIDLGIGGVLMSQNAKFYEKSDLYVGDQIENVRVSWQEGSAEIQIGIKEAVIKRILKKAESHRYDYGIEFVEIGKMEEEKLGTFILNRQRASLKTRIGISNGQ
jgi:c-di-GMP-binding flagellar brake protein YcgR